MKPPRSQFSLKADLPVGFPYRFNSRFIYFLMQAGVVGSEGVWVRKPVNHGIEGVNIS